MRTLPRGGWLKSALAAACLVAAAAAPLVQPLAAHAAWNPSTTWSPIVTGDFNGDGKTDVAGFDTTTGQWLVGTSSGSAFPSTVWATWSSSVPWVVRTGDFNGDGKTDIAGFDPLTGQWWVGLSTGTSFKTTLWTTWNSSLTWVDINVADFNHDGKSDIIGRALSLGQWWVGLSSGSGFSNTLWATWSTGVTWVDVHVGDFNGDGLPDIAGRALSLGQWWVGINTGAGGFTSSLWATWGTGVTWVDVNVGDFNGDGKTDIAGRALSLGQWWVGVSNGVKFTTTLWDTWSTSVTWIGVSVGDFNGDGKADIAGRDASTGDWWVGVSTGSGFSNTLWTTWSTSFTWVVRAGDFNGDGRTDLAGFIPSNGQWWVALSSGTAFSNSLFDTIAGDPAITAAGAGTFNAVEGGAFSGFPVATFTDPDGQATPGDYTATIDWGDATPAATGTITLTAGSFTVTGGHTYAEEGGFTVTVTISDGDTPANHATVTTPALVLDAVVIATPVPVAATAGVAFTAPLATFTDAGGAEAASDYSVTSIDWGDGSPLDTTSGIISAGDTFAASGAHTYAAAGAYVIRVVLDHEGFVTALNTSANVTGKSCAALTGCNLKETNFSNANLAGADLSNANLNRANLTGAALRGADLTNANLLGANLTNADLTGATTTGANFNKVTWSNTTCPDGTNSNADGGTCEGHL